MSDRRPCPVCESTESHVLLHRQRFDEGVLGEGYDVVVCSRCGAGFADGIPSQEELDCYYAEQSKYAYENSSGAESPYDLQRFELAVDQVVPFLPSKHARILDIGCATGGLLSVFKRRGYDNVLGADPSPACVGAARRLHGVEARAATLAHIASWSERFDLILMIGVLEHLREVKGAVEVVAARLNPQGLFYAAVPDAEGLADSCNAPFQQFSMEHVNFFSQPSLDLAVARVGFSAKQCWQKTVEWREGVTEPVLACLFEKTPVARPTLTRDRISEMALGRYITRSRTQDARIAAEIDRLVASFEPLLVWGAGALTRRLLATTALPAANIIGFVDNRPALHGKRLHGAPIFSPAQIAGRRETILLCSVAFEKEILAQIRDHERLKNPVITFSALLS
jgi:SAM-dependent methyltransferase